MRGRRRDGRLAGVRHAALDDLERDLRAIFARFPTAGTANETQTEDDLIWPVLERLGWTAHLRQQNLSAHGRADVPDGLLFADDEAKTRANLLPEEWRRYELGLAVVESKRWGTPARPPLGAAGRRVRAVDADAALPPARRRPGHRRTALGYPRRRPLLAALLRRGAFGSPSSSSRSISQRSSAPAARATCSLSATRNAATR